MVTAIVLTKNNQKEIERTLESLQWCEEVLVIDDYSTDKTVELSRDKGAKIVQRHLEGDFAEQRNAALKSAQQEWVLFVDSDEIVSKDLAKEIQRVLQQTDCVGYYLKRTDWVYNRALRFGETASVRLLRLAKRDAGLWKSSVHETWEINGKVGILIQPLQHYPHSTITDFLADINIYSTMVSLQRLKDKQTVTAWQIIAYPLGKFLHNYFWRQGFRDGVPGAILAIMMSFHSFLVRAKMFHARDQQQITFDNV